MDRPDAAAILKLSKVDFDALGYGDEGDMQVIVDQADAYVEFVTARGLDSSMPSQLASIATQTCRMRTEQIAFQAQEDYIEGAADDIVGSFTAGSYSETRHDPTRRGETKALNSWPALSDLLWLLLGTTSSLPNDAVDERREYWMMMLMNIFAPAFAVTEVAWANVGGRVMSSDVPWLVEPRGSLAGGDLWFPGQVNLDAWSW